MNFESIRTVVGHQLPPRGDAAERCYKEFRTVDDYLDICSLDPVQAEFECVYAEIRSTSPPYLRIWCLSPTRILTIEARDVTDPSRKPTASFRVIPINSISSVESAFGYYGESVLTIACADGSAHQITLDYYDRHSRRSKAWLDFANRLYAKLP